MEVKVTKSEPKFNPIDLKITIETQEEFDALFGIVNYSVIVSQCVHKNDKSLNEKKTEEVLHKMFDALFAFKKSNI